MRVNVATILLLKKYNFQKFKNGLFAHKNQSICYKPQSTKTQVNIPFEHFAQKNHSTRYNRKKCIFVHFCNTCFRSIPTTVTRSHSAFAQKNQSTRYNQTGRYNTLGLCGRALFFVTFQHLLPQSLHFTEQLLLRVSLRSLYRKSASEQIGHQNTLIVKMHLNYDKF